MKSLTGKKSVLIVQPILAHYRFSLFQRLASSQEFDIHIVAGKQIDNVKEIDELSPKIQATLTNKKIKAGSHNLIWQAGIIKYVRKFKPEIIVLTGVDPHLLSNLFLTFFNKFFLSFAMLHSGFSKTILARKNRVRLK